MRNLIFLILHLYCCYMLLLCPFFKGAAWCALGHSILCSQWSCCPACITRRKLLKQYPVLQCNSSFLRSVKHLKYTVLSIYPLNKEMLLIPSWLSYVFNTLLLCSLHYCWKIECIFHFLVLWYFVQLIVIQFLIVNLNCILLLPMLLLLFQI